jgi:glycosyltransferase involved in cell wall biosynthesis
MSDCLPVSVIIPAYNRENMIGRAVASALGQRPLPPAEVIVVDDCSADGTGAAAAAAGARVVRHERNRGEGAARNTGIANAAHQWVGLLDSDDEWLPHLLATLWPLRTGHVIVGGASLSCGRELANDRYSGPLSRRPQVLRSPSAVIYPENFIAASGTMARRDVVQAVGGYVEGLKRGADMDLWIRMLERGTGIIVPRPVVLYHLHEGQVTQDGAAMADAHRAVARSYADRPWWSASALERWEGAAAYDATRRALSSADPVRALRSLGRLLSRPRRTTGAIGVIVRRARLRRRSGSLDRTGAPTTAILPKVDAAADSSVDLRDMTTLRALARLAWRPTQAAVASSRLQAVGARLVGVDEVRIDGRDE